jgi:integrase
MATALDASADTKYLAISQAAKSLPVPVSVRTIRSWIVNGLSGKKLACIRVGNRRFVEPSELAKFVSSSQKGGAPNARWRGIIALARYGGLRIPSELTRLTWRDIDFDSGRIRIHAPKKENHKGWGIRYCPLFPELRPAECKDILEFSDEFASFTKFVRIECRDC